MRLYSLLSCTSMVDGQLYPLSPVVHLIAYSKALNTFYLASLLSVTVLCISY